MSAEHQEDTASKDGQASNPWNEQTDAKLLYGDRPELSELVVKEVGAGRADNRGAKQRLGDGLVGVASAVGSIVHEGTGHKAKRLHGAAIDNEEAAMGEGKDALNRAVEQEEALKTVDQADHIANAGDGFDDIAGKGKRMRKPAKDEAGLLDKAHKAIVYGQVPKVAPSTPQTDGQIMDHADNLGKEAAAVDARYAEAPKTLKEAHRAAGALHIVVPSIMGGLGKLAENVVEQGADNAHAVIVDESRGRVEPDTAERKAERHRRVKMGRAITAAAEQQVEQTGVIDPSTGVFEGGNEQAAKVYAAALKEAGLEIGKKKAAGRELTQAQEDAIKRRHHRKAQQKLLTNAQATQEASRAYSEAKAAGEPLSKDEFATLFAEKEARIGPAVEAGLDGMQSPVYADADVDEMYAAYKQNYARGLVGQSEVRADIIDGLPVRTDSLLANTKGEPMPWQLDGLGISADAQEALENTFDSVADIRRAPDVKLSNLGVSDRDISKIREHTAFGVGEVDARLATIAESKEVDLGKAAALEDPFASRQNDARMPEVRRILAGPNTPSEKFDVAMSSHPESPEGRAARELADILGVDDLDTQHHLVMSLPDNNSKKKKVAALMATMDGATTVGKRYRQAMKSPLGSPDRQAAEELVKPKLDAALSGSAGIHMREVDRGGRDGVVSLAERQLVSIKTPRGNDLLIPAGVVLPGSSRRLAASDLPGKPMVWNTQDGLGLGGSNDNVHAKYSGAIGGMLQAGVRHEVTRVTDPDTGIEPSLMGALGGAQNILVLQAAHKVVEPWLPAYTQLISAHPAHARTIINDGCKVADRTSVTGSAGEMNEANIASEAMLAAAIRAQQDGSPDMAAMIGARLAHKMMRQRKIDREGGHDEGDQRAHGQVGAFTKETLQLIMTESTPDVVAAIMGEVGTKLAVEHSDVAPAVIEKAMATMRKGLDAAVETKSPDVLAAHEDLTSQVTAVAAKTIEIQLAALAQAMNHTPSDQEDAREHNAKIQKLTDNIARVVRSLPPDDGTYPDEVRILHAASNSPTITHEERRMSQELAGAPAEALTARAGNNAGLSRVERALDLTEGAFIPRSPSNKEATYVVLSDLARTWLERKGIIAQRAKDQDRHQQEARAELARQSIDPSSPAGRKMLKQSAVKTGVDIQGMNAAGVFTLIQAIARGVGAGVSKTIQPVAGGSEAEEGITVKFPKTPANSFEARRAAHVRKRLATVTGALNDELPPDAKPFTSQDVWDMFAGADDSASADMDALGILFDLASKGAEDGDVDGSLVGLEEAVYMARLAAVGAFMEPPVKN